MISALFAEKFLVPFIPVATVAGIGGSCLYIYSDEVFGPGAGYDIFIVGKTTALTPDVTVDAELYLEQPTNDSQGVSNKSINPFLLADSLPAAQTQTQTQVQQPASPSESQDNAEAQAKKDVPKKIRNYKCGLSLSEKPVNESCYLTKKATLSNESKNWFNLSHFGIPKEYDYLVQTFDKPIIETPTEVTKNDLKTKDNYIVIQVTESLFNQVDWSDSQTLDVYQLDNKELVFGKLKPLFAIYGNYVGVLTEYVLVKAEEIITVNPTSGGTTAKETTHKLKDSSDSIPAENICYRTHPIGASDTHKANCTFNKFSGDTKHTGEKYWYRHATFSGTITAADEIEVDKYYLIKFDQKYYAKAIVDMDLYYSIPSSLDESKKKLIKFSTAIPVITSTISDKENLFIFTQT